MYSLSHFQRYQALQSLPLFTNQQLSEQMDKMLVLLPKDEKPGIFSEVYLWTSSQLIFENIFFLNLSVTLVEGLFRLMNCGRSLDAASRPRL